MQVPRAVSDAIYGRVQGAEWNVQNSIWTIPCDQLLNLTFKFGGISFPIHPLDVSSSDFDMVDPSGNTVCAGAVGLSLCSDAISLLIIHCAYSSNPSHLHSACSESKSSSQYKQAHIIT